jgi:3-mercaptopyruvate sulfurtransferase SseA
MRRNCFYLWLMVLLLAWPVAAQTQQKDERKVSALPVIEGDPDLTPKDRMTVQMLKQRMDDRAKLLIIDSRSDGAWQGSQVKIKGAVRIAHEQLEKELKSGRLKPVPRSREIVVYCS